MDNRPLQTNGHKNSLPTMERMKLLLGSSDNPESQWGSLEVWEPCSEYLQVQPFLIKGGQDLKRAPMSMKRLQGCLHTIVKQEEAVRDFLTDQIHPSMRRMDAAGVPWSLARVLLLEVCCLKYRGTAGMREMAEDEHAINLGQ